MIIDIPKVANKNVSFIKKYLIKFKSENLSNDKHNNLLLSDWRFTDSQGRVIEITFLNNQADTFLVSGDFFKGLNPVKDRFKIMGMVGFAKLPPPNRAPIKNSKGSDWDNLRGFSQISLSANGLEVACVLVKVTQRI